ncbi:MAG: polysaccharide biosynthesis/export family protein [Thermodesulfobacteriota bacterium]|nr:polysaccharide biosynthesis/export family protein [Thermodesulfobacteriota bacterium]
MMLKVKIINTLIAIFISLYFFTGCSKYRKISWDKEHKRWVYTYLNPDIKEYDVAEYQKALTSKELKESKAVISVEKVTKTPTVLKEIEEEKESYKISSHDKLLITVYNKVFGITLYGENFTKQDLTNEVEVRNDGMIFFPLIGDIRVENLTIPEARFLIKQKLSKYIKSPEIDIQVSEYGSQTVTVLGEVNKPGLVEIKGKDTVLDVLAMAEGITEKSNLKESYIIRDKNVLPVDLDRLLKHGDLNQNIPLKKRDIIFVPNVEEKRVFVLGEVEEPKLIKMGPYPMTIVDAISEAGDITIGAKRDNIKIIRGGLIHPTIITVYYERLLSGDLRENITLENGDIVYVPATYIKEWNKILELLTPSINTILLGASLATR